MPEGDSQPPSFLCSRAVILCVLSSLLAYALQVTPEGEYQPPPPSNAKASYATMVYVRATIVEGAGWALAKSVTIAVCALFLLLCNA